MTEDLKTLEELEISITTNTGVSEYMTPTKDLKQETKKWIKEIDKAINNEENNLPEEWNVDFPDDPRGHLMSIKFVLKYIFNISEEEL